MLWTFDDLLPTFDSGTFTFDVGVSGGVPIAVFLIIPYEIRLAAVNPQERIVMVFE